MMGLAAQSMQGVNETLIINLPLIMPLIEKIRLFIDSLQWLFGGIFGLYLLLVFLRWREYRMMRKILSEIRDDIRQLSEDIRAVNERVNKTRESKNRKKF